MDQVTYDTWLVSDENRVYPAVLKTAECSPFSRVFLLGLWSFLSIALAAGRYPIRAPHIIRVGCRVRVGCAYLSKDGNEVENEDMKVRLAMSASAEVL